MAIEIGRTIEFTSHITERDKLVFLRSSHAKDHTLALIDRANNVCQTQCASDIRYRCNPKTILNGTQLIVYGDPGNGVIGTDNCVLYTQGVKIGLPSGR